MLQALQSCSRVGVLGAPGTLPAPHSKWEIVEATIARRDHSYNEFLECHATGFEQTMWGLAFPNGGIHAFGGKGLEMWLKERG